jgi:hypothetical protein
LLVTFQSTRYFPPSLYLSHSATGRWCLNPPYTPSSPKLWYFINAEIVLFTNISSFDEWLNEHLYWVK